MTELKPLMRPSVIARRPSFRPTRQSKHSTYGRSGTGSDCHLALKTRAPRNDRTKASYAPIRHYKEAILPADAAIKTFHPRPFRDPFGLPPRPKNQGSS